MKYTKIKKGRARCEICGTKFPIIAEKRYTAGANSGLASIGNQTYYDAFDCPQCGCQNRVGLRMEATGENKGGRES